MKRDEYKQFLGRNVLFTQEVAEKLNVSRQRVSKLSKEGKLVPFKSNANGAIYLWRDVLEYMEEKGITPRYEYPRKPRFLCHNSGTYRNVEYAKTHLLEMKEIERVSIYFEEIDAAVENYFFISDEYSHGDLRFLEVPHMVLVDVNGDEMWLPGCNCGYGGTGPSGSEDVLKIIGVPKELQEYVCKYPVVKYVKNESGEWEVNYRKSDFDFRSGGYDRAHAHMYWHQGRLTLLQDKSDRHSDSRCVLEQYWAFIPHPVEYRLFATNEQAIGNGYFDPGYRSAYYGGAYKLIIRDYSGRQLWLDPYVENGKNLKKQLAVRDILEICGFELDVKATDMRIMQWLELLLRPVNENTVIIGKRDPFEDMD